MPSLRSKQRLKQCIFLGVSTLFLSSALIGCGSGESEAKIQIIPPSPSEPKPKNFEIKVPLEMRDVIIRIFDNFDNSLILEQQVTTTDNLSLTLPKVLNLNHIYRIEISSKPNSTIYDFQSGQYKTLNSTFHSLVEVNTSNLTQKIFINPSSEAIFERSIIRSGGLPQDIRDPSLIKVLHLRLATEDVNYALVGSMNNDIKNLSPSTSTEIFKPINFNNQSTYVNTYLTFGHVQFWGETNLQEPYIEFTKNLAIDLRDGYLDGKKIRGDSASLISLISENIDNIDPSKNTLINISNNQKNIRDLYAYELKNAVLKLAQLYEQPTFNPSGYQSLLQKQYSGATPQTDSKEVVRVVGAGDYRRAVGFVDTTATCNGSIYPCKQGLTGINIINPNLPSIEYLIGHYQDTVNNCQLNIRANGTLELIKGSQIYRSVLDADSTDNLLQVDKANNQYILNSSSTEPNNPTLQYTFVQVQIKSNQVMSASAGLDSRKAPDQLQTTQLECSFS
ncbi:hypothetical protein [Acinetobacter beijerinckii]|uniref:hypothetical protein n=1 Tax=Acinetobacter beijerinckii TaxID=262668 RepID=UPI003AF9E479